MSTLDHSKIPFRCNQSGHCCQKNIIILSPFDIFRLATFLGKTATELFQRKLLTYSIHPSTLWMDAILNSQHGPCPFLQKSSTHAILCSVHRARPITCRIYPLKYDSEQNQFFRFLPAEMRCFACCQNEKDLEVDSFLQEQQVQPLLPEWREYHLFKEELIDSGWTINRIKNQKDKQEIFFQIQKLLFETYPNNSETHQQLPFGKIKEKINHWLK